MKTKPKTPEKLALYKEIRVRVTPREDKLRTFLSELALIGLTLRTYLEKKIDGGKP